MATYPSTLIQSGQSTPSVTPNTVKPVVGTVVIPAGITIAANDTMPLFYMAGGSPTRIINYFIDSPALDSGATLTVSLLDSTTPTPNTIINASTAFRAGAVLTAATALRATMGAAVGYTAPPNLIFLRAVAAAGASVGASPVSIYFVFEIEKD